MSRFANIEYKDERRAAAALLASYNRQIAQWQRSADRITNSQYVDLKTYIGYTERELDEFETLDEFESSLSARRQAIDESVNAERERMTQRSLDEHDRAEKNRSEKNKKRGRGRPKTRLNLLSYGQYVHFAVAYNHGLGAGFKGYGVGGAEPSPVFAPSHIVYWPNYNPYDEEI